METEFAKYDSYGRRDSIRLYKQDREDLSKLSLAPGSTLLNYSPCHFS